MTENNKKIVFILIGEGFPLLSLSLVMEPLRIANRESPRPIFDWKILSVNKKMPRSSSGRRLPADGFLDESVADAVILLASYAPGQMRSEKLMAWLRRQALRGAVMGCVDTGALLFAEAGLLDRRPAAVHHEAIVGFREKSGDAFFVDRLFDFDQDRCSAAGGVVTIDMTLELIAHFASPRLARRVAEVLNYKPLDTGRAEGRFGIDWSIPRVDRMLGKAVEIMQANVETPAAIAEICARLDMPNWQLRRLFHRHLGMSPQAYYLEIRLDRARNLLRNSQETVGTIALMCGFPASESLSRRYKDRFGVSPSKDRRL